MHFGHVKFVAVQCERGTIQLDFRIRPLGLGLGVGLGLGLGLGFPDSWTSGFPDFSDFSDLNGVFRF